GAVGGKPVVRTVRDAAMALFLSVLGRREARDPAALGGPGGEVASILFLRLDRLGDLLVSTPTIAAVRSRFPDARITLLVSPRSVQIAPWVPGVGEVLRFDRERPTAWPALLRALRSRRFDLAFDLSAAFASAPTLVA